MRAIADVRPAGEFLKRMAPTQTHENRRNFLAAANLLDGINLFGEPNEIVVVSLPLKRDGKYVGDAMVTINTHGFEIDNDDPHVHAEFKRFEVPEPS